MRQSRPLKKKKTAKRPGRRSRREDARRAVTKGAARAGFAWLRGEQSVVEDRIAQALLEGQPRRLADDELLGAEVEAEALERATVRVFERRRRRPPLAPRGRLGLAPRRDRRRHLMKKGSFLSRARALASIFVARRRCESWFRAGEARLAVRGVAAAARRDDLALREGQQAPRKRRVHGARRSDVHRRRRLSPIAVVPFPRDKRTLSVRPLFSFWIERAPDNSPRTPNSRTSVALALLASRRRLACLRAAP